MGGDVQDTPRATSAIKAIDSVPWKFDQAGYTLVERGTPDLGD